jgi:hypothetical protein
MEEDVLEIEAIKKLSKFYSPNSPCCQTSHCYLKKAVNG